MGAIHFTFESPEWTRRSLAGALIVFFLFGLFYRRAWWSLLVLETAIAVRFALLTPAAYFSDVQWQTPWARMPRIENTDDGVKISNVRNFRYRTEHDYDAAYRTMKVRREHLRTLDVLLSHWDNHEAIAHTMLRFNFAKGPSLVVSMETRLPRGAAQGFLPGIYKQYELIMLLGTNDDLVKLRTDYRGETVYAYRTRAAREQVLEIFDQVMARADELGRKPEFYNSITENCTTSLVPLLRAVNPDIRNDIRFLCNGFSDQLLYQAGYLETRENESFGALKARSILPGLSHGSARIRNR